MTEKLIHTYPGNHTNQQIDPIVKAKVYAGFLTPLAGFYLFDYLNKGIETLFNIDIHSGLETAIEFGGAGLVAFGAVKCIGLLDHYIHK